MDSELIRIPQTGGHVTSLFFSPTTHDEIFGTILILHGMAEHYERYFGFIKMLNNEGFDVYAYDHRGHGKLTPTTELGYFAKKDGAALVVSDAVNVCHYIKEHSRSDKFAVFGHSMGSLILRNVIQQYDAMDCAVICGTTMLPVAVSSAGLVLSNLLSALLGPKRPSPFLNRMLFENASYAKVCLRTKCDWLTRDDAIVDAYINDIYCGFVCTHSMYRDIVALSRQAAQPSLMQKTRKNLPLYLISGEQDPVGGFGEQVTSLYELYGSLGFTDIAMTLYPGARHELLNELNRETVMQDCADFFHKYLG